MSNESRLLALVLVRATIGDGVRYDLDDIAAEFGIDPAELDAE